MKLKMLLLSLEKNGCSADMLFVFECHAASLLLFVDCVIVYLVYFYVHALNFSSPSSFFFYAGGKSKTKNTTCTR